MSLSRAYVDGFLIDWEDGEYRAQVKTLSARSKTLAVSSEIGSSALIDRRGKRLTTAQHAQAIRERLDRTTRRVPEVMVKITSSCKGMRQVGNHIDYISRKGQIDVEDQDGFIVSGKSELKDLKDDWRLSGAEVIGEESDRRDTLNIVFSMPAYTDEVSMKRAVRAFAAKAYHGHQYVFAYHTQATDPDPDPPAHPHVHLSVKMLGRDGVRMNPRKADLQAWREDFAFELRAHGIEANATTRLARFKRQRGAARSVIALEAKGEKTSLGEQGMTPIDVDTKHTGRRQCAVQLEKDRLDYYYAAGRVLVRSVDPDDKRLGLAIAHYVRQALMSPEKPVPTKAELLIKDQER